MAIEALSGWTKEQKSVVAAAYLGWMLDAFDFFLMVFVFRDIAAEFTPQIPAVAVAVVLTLAMRPSAPSFSAASRTVMADAPLLRPSF